MKNILFKILPLLAAVLFAISCSKDDGNDNTVLPDNTPSVTPAPDPSTPSETVQVQYDENGVPYIPFSITVGKEDSESLSKYFASDFEGSLKQYFNKEDKISITGKDKKINGELKVDEKKWGNRSYSTTATFSGMLWGEDIESLAEGDWLIATLNEPLSKPKEYNTGDDKLIRAITNCGYLTTEFQYISNDNYSTYYGNEVDLKQHTAFLVFDMEYSAKVVIEYNGTDYPFYLQGSASSISGNTRQTVIAVPDGSYVRSSILKKEREINIEKDGTVIHNIKRLQPDESCTSRGTFSISKDKQVFFSTGNLVYGISSDVIGFQQPWGVEFKNGEDVGTNHENMNGKGYVDLFGWGTWLKGATTNLLMTTTYSYSYEWTGDAHTVADYFYDEIWYTLTKDEWDYLLNKREMNPDNTQQIRYIRASIKLKDDGSLVPGLIVFPDCCPWDIANKGWMFPPFTETYDVNGNFEDNIIEQSSWNNFSIDTQGAIFLPCAGVRSGSYGTVISDCYNKGYYWTSSSQNKPSAYGLHISNDGVTLEGTDKCYGYAVRLVRDVK